MLLYSGLDKNLTTKLVQVNGKKNIGIMSIDLDCYEVQRVKCLNFSVKFVQKKCLFSY